MSEFGGSARLFGAGATSQHGPASELASRLGRIAGLAHFGRVPGQTFQHQIGVIQLILNGVQPVAIRASSQVDANV